MPYCLWYLLYLILDRKILPTLCYRPCFKILVIEQFVLVKFFIWASVLKCTAVFAVRLGDGLVWTLPTHLPPSLFVPSFSSSCFLRVWGTPGVLKLQFENDCIQQLFEVVSVILFSILGIGEHNSWKWVSQGLISNQSSKQFQSVLISE